MNLDLDDFIGKKVITTCLLREGAKKEKIGIIFKGGPKSWGKDYTHRIMPIDGSSNPILYISNLPEHACYSWKLLKKKIG